jgi:hypothetical protein
METIADTSTDHVIALNPGVEGAFTASLRDAKRGWGRLPRISSGASIMTSLREEGSFPRISFGAIFMPSLREESLQPLNAYCGILRNTEGWQSG